MKKGLTTHILDLTNGVPAQNVVVELWKIGEESAEKIFLSSAKTDEQGRIDNDLLEQIDTGEYELLFHVGNYFQTMGTPLAKPIFFNRIAIRVALSSDNRHYHIPLLISPWGYQTYRGS